MSVERLHLREDVLQTTLVPGDVALDGVHTAFQCLSEAAQLAVIAENARVNAWGGFDTLGWASRGGSGGSSFLVVHSSESVLHHNGRGLFLGSNFFHGSSDLVHSSNNVLLLLGRSRFFFLGGGGPNEQSIGMDGPFTRKAQHNIINNNNNTAKSLQLPVRGVIVRRRIDYIAQSR